MTSEQIKADIKAATERTNSKEPPPETGEASAGPGPVHGNVQNSAEAGSSSRERPVSTSAGRVRPAATPSGRVGGCRRVLDGNNPTVLPDRTAGLIRTGEVQSKAQNGDGFSAETMQGSSGPGGVDSRGSKCPAPGTAGQDGHGERQAATTGASVTGSQLNPSQNFLPRRPLTRSCTRTSSAPLVAETGKSSADEDFILNFITRLSPAAHVFKIS